MRQETIINHPTFKVVRRTGSEGPRHDPYHFEELHVETRDGKTVLHEGLGLWLKHECRSGYKLTENRVHCVHDVFKAMTGYSTSQIDRIAIRLQSRCRKCGCRDFDDVRGYPGETLYQCVDCKHINGSSQDYSAIE